MNQHAKMLLLFIYGLCTSFVHAEVATHYYDIEQGFVQYEILGGAQLTDETNLNIQGSSTLRFKEWGNIRQEEDRGVVVTKGAINYVQEVRRLEKHINGKVIVVDYDNEQLLEQPSIDTVSSFIKETEGLVQRGQDVIAGVLCKIWVGPSVTKCIYKGVVLKQESHVLGISYSKKAVKAEFDINATYEQCILPPFPKNMFGIIRDNPKIKKSDTVENVCNVFKDVVHEVDADNKSFEPYKVVDTKKRNKFINKIAKGIFKKQKEILPKLFLLMKKTRECLHLAEGILEKQQCIFSYREGKSNLGFDEESYVIFEDYEVDSLDRIEEAIIDFAPRMPCIKRAKNFIDLSSCMK